ncbi:lactonase family protein [Paeniglutamicibacter gangotriensis]|uniref:6-phosphogluconolactonase n=1 Tax=Paeniglutamicibacter gangotriensis Lz1y TaxID=1276920 RepID=M7N628_9MICC|nr:beta-propeller fold lactonase family protein [Paeniglutamicibacter gangotriensis]EMQ97214.1 6-phosphogluconolactonase [Paeniglutamicibacter gangotriensis Lz1y]
MEKRFWVGGYSPDGGGTSLGIRAMGYTQGVLTDLGLAHAAESPSWLATHPRLPVLYAALEHRGEVAAYRILGHNKLEPLGKPKPAGALLCHLVVAEAAGALVASCYGDGKMLAYPMDADGTLSDPVPAAESIDPFAVPGHPERASHSHQATVLRSGVIATTDLGHDAVRFWDLVQGQWKLRQQLGLRKGDGPRHLVEHPSGFIYVVTEHGAEVITLRADAAGVYRELCRTGLGEKVLAGSDFPAEISLDTNNDRLYIGVRGAGIVAVLNLVSGRPVLRGSGSCAGAWPRHHVQVGNSLLVANQLSNTIEAIGLEGADGLPQVSLSSLPMESPTCIAAQVTV